MVKAIGYVLFTASAVTLYVHIHNHDLHMPHFGKLADEPTETSTPGEIVIAPLHNNNLTDRWQGDPNATARK
jgi:hypothetical protein